MCVECIFCNIWCGFVQDYYAVRRGLLGGTVNPSIYTPHA